MECMSNLNRIINLKHLKRFLRKVVRSVICNKKMVSLCIVTLTICSLAFLIFHCDKKANANAEYDTTKYFTTIQVEEGDSLWSISEEYMTPEYASVQSYIKEVKKINGISDDAIKVGSYLTIPYYAESPN